MWLNGSASRNKLTLKRFAGFYFSFTGNYHVLAPTGCATMILINTLLGYFQFILLCHFQCLLPSLPKESNPWCEIGFCCVHMSKLNSFLFYVSICCKKVNIHKKLTTSIWHWGPSWNSLSSRERYVQNCKAAGPLQV